MTPSPPLPATAYVLLRDRLDAVSDLGVHHLSEADLSGLCIASCLSVPIPERTWHGHQLRRQLAEAYRGIGYALVDGCYDVRGLLDAIGALGTAADD